MAIELKPTIINMKTLTQDINSPIVVNAGDATGSVLRIIFTQEAAAQFTENTKVYLSWVHQEKNIKGYNIFTEVVSQNNESNFPPTWEIHYPHSMLYEGNVLACIEIVDEISIAASKNFIIHVLVNPNDGSEFLKSNDFTEFQQAIIKLATTEDQIRSQFNDKMNEFENMRLTFQEMQQQFLTIQETVNEAIKRVDDFDKELHPNA